MQTGDGDLALRMQAAIDDGEILRVRYDRGSQPGTVRDIRPVLIAGDRIRALDEASVVPKVFILKYLEIVSVDEPTTYVVRKTKRKTIKDPASITKHWHFSVTMPAFAAAFDIASVSRKRTNLHTGKRTTVHIWTQGDPPVYQFDEGDLFHHPPEAATSPWGLIARHQCIQIMDADDEIVEIAAQEFHHGKLHSRAHSVKLTIDDFLTILRDGPEAPPWKKLLWRPKLEISKS
jgi:hypothetical protein